MSKQTSQRIAVTFTVSAALLVPMFMQNAQAQTSVSPTTSVSPAVSAALPTQSKDIIVVDAKQGLRRNCQDQKLLQLSSRYFWHRTLGIPSRY